MHRLCCPWKLFETFCNRMRRKCQAQSSLLDSRFDRFARAAVKFKFTGTLFASVTARLATITFSRRQHDADALFVVGFFEMTA